MKGRIEVELYHSRVGPPAEWRARRPGTRLDFPSITPQSRPDTLQKQIELLSFERKVIDWQAFDGDYSREPLQATDWHMDKDGRVFLTEEYREKMNAKKNAVTK